MVSEINIWTQKTLDLATKSNYLDKLLEIYPAKLPPSRTLPRDIKNTIIKLYNEKKYVELVILLINLKDINFPFPIEHPYAALLRHLSKRVRPYVIKRNPGIIKELADLVMSLGLDNIVRGVERPKDINRTLGAAFKLWVQKRFSKPPFKIVQDCSYLLKCESNEICIYVGPDEQIAYFIKSYLNLKEPEKGFFDRDIIAKVKDHYIIGEARFLSTPGGSQNRDLDNTLKFVESMEEIAARKRDVRAIALLDGVIWFHAPYVRKITRKAIGDRVVMSALFLEEYLLEFFNKLL